MKNIKALKHNRLAILLLLFSPHIFAQKVKELSYPKGYFMFPIRPGLINHLSGTLGDLRSMHFHGGLDIKTEQRIGLPVYAAADGYVQEIRVSTSGYGNGLFIKHPNGMTTVYGHLDSFQGDIGEIATRKRYEDQTFELSYKPEINEIPVKKGQIIGLSGNSGGSGGPHLHFEIRNEFNNLLNPLYFGFSEISDSVPPQIQGIIIKALQVDSRINQKFGRQFFYPKKTTAGYNIAENIIANGEIGLEMLAVDKMNFNNNSYGISCIEMHVNGEESFYFHLEKIPVEDSRDINLHIDYALEKTIGKKYQRLNLADGNNKLPIYKPDANAGKLKIEHGKSYNIEIKAWDSFENLSKLNFTILGDTTRPNLNLKPSKLSQSIDYQIDENTLIVTLKNAKSLETVCELGVNGKSVELPIAYLQNSNAVFLYDLRKGLPQYVEIDEIQQPFLFTKSVPSSKSIDFISGNFKIKFTENSIYDTLHLELNDRNGKSFQIGQSTVPLAEPIEVEYKTKGQFNPSKDLVYNVYGNARRLQKTEWDSNRVKFRINELGDFQILNDTIAPIIHPVIKNSNKLAFRISDNLAGIKSFRAEVDGKYVLMDYDFKRRLIWSIKSDSTETFVGDLKLSVVDNAGNESTYESNMDVPLPTPKLKKSKGKPSKKGKTIKKKTNSRKKSKKK